MPASEHGRFIVLNRIDTRAINLRKSSTSDTSKGKAASPAFLSSCALRKWRSAQGRNRRATFKPQSHRIVRFIDRTIGCYFGERATDRQCLLRSAEAVGRMLRSVFLAGYRSSYDSSYA